LAAGTYCVKVRGCAHESTGWYDLYVTVEEGEEDGDSEGTPVHVNVVLPYAGSGSIDAIDEDDFYCFTLSQPGLVTVDVDANQYGSSLDPVLELYDENGDEIAYGDDEDGYDPYLQEYLAAGSYCVKVRGYGHDSTGWYDLYVTVGEGEDDEEDDDQGTPVHVNVVLPYAGSGSIDAIEEDDFYCFTLSQPGVVTVDVDADQYGSSLDPVLELYDEDWDEIGYNDDTDDYDPYLDEYLVAGSYCVKVRGCAHESMGAYELYIAVDYDGTDDGIDSTPEYEEVDLPYSGSGSIDAIDENDFYCFYVTRPSVVTFDVDADQYGSSLDPVLELYNEDAERIAYNDDTDDYDPYLEEYLEIGAYCLNVRGCAHESTGWYELYITVDVDGEVDGSPSSPGYQDVDLPYSGSGSIDAIEEDNFYCFTLSQPGVVTFDVDADQLGSSLDPVLELYDENGDQIAYNDDTDGLDSYLEEYLEAGSYCVKVRGCAHESTGWYEFHIH